MNNQNPNRFMEGLWVGLALGGAAVFLLGTRTGKNLLKIISEQGLDGLVNILEEYDLGGLEEEDGEQDYADNTPSENSHSEQASAETNEGSNNQETPPKKRFFKRVKK